MKGLERAQARLQQLSVRAARALQGAVEDAGAETLSAARDIVPVRTGRLKASLYMQPEETACRVAATAPYAVFVEWGTRYMSPRPFLLPAAREADFFARAARAVKEILQ